MFQQEYAEWQKTYSHFYGRKKKRQDSNWESV